MLKCSSRAANAHASSRTGTTVRENRGCWRASCPATSVASSNGCVSPIWNPSWTSCPRSQSRRSVDSKLRRYPECRITNRTFISSGWRHVRTVRLFDALAIAEVRRAKRLGNALARRLLPEGPGGERGDRFDVSHHLRAVGDGQLAGVAHRVDDFERQVVVVKSERQSEQTRQRRSQTRRLERIRFAEVEAVRPGGHTP